MNALASFVQAPLMTAAPGLAICPLALGCRLPPCLPQATSTDSICDDCLFGAFEPSSTLASSGTVSTASTFWVAAVFIAEATPASVHLPFLPRCWVSARFSSDIRPTDRCDQKRQARH